MLLAQKHLNFMAAAKAKDPDAYMDSNNFYNIYKDLWEVENRDARAGQEIINDTLKEFGIKIKRGSDSQ